MKYTETSKVSTETMIEGHMDMFDGEDNSIITAEDKSGI